jgi:arabinose-5-phosphate isomerase
MCDALAMTLKKIKQFSAEDFGMYHPGGALGKQLSWTVADIVDPSQKPWVSSHAPINEVIQSLSSGRFGITVLLEDGKIQGVITDGDLRRMLEKYTDFSSLCAKDIASLNPKTIPTHLLAKDALRIINEYAIGQLVVVDSKGTYYGIIDFHSLTNEGIQA